MPIEPKPTALGAEGSVCPRCGKRYHSTLSELFACQRGDFTDAQVIGGRP